MSHFINKNNDVIIHAPTSFRGVRNAKEVIYYDKPQELFSQFFTSGELENIEQNMAVRTKKGLIIITGCSHPAMETTIETLSKFGDIYGIIGGLHGFDQYELFQEFKLISRLKEKQEI